MGCEKDAKEAEEWYEKAAESDNPTALCNLGVIFERRNEADKAVEMYSKAAALGHHAAQYNLGICYKDGFGVEADELKAAQWLAKAASVQSPIVRMMPPA